MLFSKQDILPAEVPDAKPLSLARKTKALVRFAESGTNIAAAIPSIEDGFSYHIPCFVHWSLHDVLERLIELTGPAHVCLTSWAISEGPARKISNLLRDGKIRSLHCLFDHRVTRYCPAAMQLVQGQMGKIKLTGIHAKIVVIENDSWGISVTSTANATNKRRIEKYVITCDRIVAEFERTWILDQINR
jgi:hypothetical protein